MLISRCMVADMVFRPRFWLRFCFCLSLIAAAVVSSGSFAQDEAPAFKPGKFKLPGLGLQGDDDKVTARGRLEITRGMSQGRVTIDVEIPEGFHIYSLTQQKPLKKTLVKVTESEQFKLTAEFQADHAPVSKADKLFKVPLEEYEGTVSFSAPLEIAAGVKPEDVRIEVQLAGQLCNEGSCRDYKANAQIAFGGYLEPPTLEFRPEGLHVVLQGELDLTAVAAGGKAVLKLAAKPDDNWHVYAYAPTHKFEAGKGSATLIAFTNKAGWTPSKVTSHPAAVAKKSGTVVDQVHKEPVVWNVELSPPAGGYAAGELVGRIGLQTCEGNLKCDAPTAVEFRVAIPAEPAANVAVGFHATSDPYQTVEVLTVEATGTSAAGSPTAKAVAPIPDLGQLGVILIFAFIGGSILNLMPCVLPVIGLKILSFARQGGESHSRVFGLNLAYSLGLILVFLLLAALAAFLNLGWGDQFQNIQFKIATTAVVFVMALSFLGVWELPIPGFATSGKAGDLQKQHGYVGAFFKGMFTTVLATPCSGPFLGAVFTFALKQQPAVIFLIFGCIGLGMASPYLLIGVFPSLIRFLPKPGEWMETFERVVGFALLATVVYLFSTFGKEQMNLFVPTLALLIALWFGCWLIGQVPEYSGFGKKALSYLAAGAIAGVVGYGGFMFFDGHADLGWEPYSEARLAEHQRAGKTVMIDFTAEWCPTCKWNLSTAINTNRVKSFTAQHGVVALLADKTETNPEIERKLEQLDSRSIPVLAIYPAGKPDQPIVLRDLLTESQVLAALEKAGPSQAKSDDRSTAMRP